MKEKQFDDFFKDKLQNYSTDVPQDMWNRIVQDKRKKRPIGFWLNNPSKGIYFLITSLLIIGGTSAWKYSSMNTSHMNIINNNSSVNISNSIKHNSNRSSDNSIIYSGISTDNKQSKNTIGYKNNLSDIATNNSNNTSKNHTSNPNITISGSSEIKTIGYNSSSLTVKKNNNVNNLNSLKTTETKVSVINSSINSEEDNTETINSKQSVDLSLATTNKILLSLSKLNISLKKPKQFSCPVDKNSVVRNWYIEVYGSPEYTFKSITNQGSTGNYLQKKDSAESMLMGYNFGVRFMRNISNKLLFKTGLQFAQYNENFSVKRENQSKTTTIIINKIITRPQGDTVISDTSSYTQVGYSYTHTINQYRNIEIPLLLSYRNDNEDNNWGWSVSGGVILDLLSWNTGNTLDTSLSVVSINSKSNNNVYSNSAFGVSLMLAGSVERKLNDNWAIFTEPYFRYGISNSIISKFRFEQKFNSLGLSFGVRYKFGNRQQY